MEEMVAVATTGHARSSDQVPPPATDALQPATRGACSSDQVPSLAKTALNPATRTTGYSDQVRPPATTALQTAHLAMEDVNNYSEEQDNEDKMKDAYISDSDLSQKILAEKIEELVKNSVQRKVKRRTTNKRKRNTVHDLTCDGDVNDDDSKTYSRFSLPYMYSVFKAVVTSDHRKQLVKNMGFEYMLELDDCYVPRAFAQWIADRILPDEGIIRIGENSIPIDPTSFVDVLGIPAGKLSVETDEEAGKYCFLHLFGLSDVPNIKFFGDKIIQQTDLSDDEFCRCFMSVLLCTFLCPNSCTRPSTKYMGALVQVDKIKERNWAKFAHDWFIFSVKKYQRERTKHKKHTITLGGCIYQSAVRYLDFVDFGSIKLPNTLPRVCVWKGKLVEHFSEINKDSSGKYGANNIKALSYTCYGAAARMTTAMRSNHATFKDNIDKVVGDFLSKEVKNDIFNAFQNHMIEADLESYSCAQNMVLDFLKVITPQCAKTNTSDTTEYLQTEDSTHENEIHEDSTHSKRNCTNEAEQLLHPGICMEHLGNKELSVSKVNRSYEEVENVIKIDTPEKQNSPILPCERSFSLNHTPELSVLMVNRSYEEVENVIKTDGSENQNPPILPCERSFSLNHTPSDDDAQSSISRPKSAPHKPNETTENNINLANPEISRVEEINNKAFEGPTLACNGHQSADFQSDSQNNISRSNFLLRALKKYHWNDPSIPSFRLFEFCDDSGTYIEEEELWRPLGCTEEQYMDRIFGHFDSIIQGPRKEKSASANCIQQPRKETSANGNMQVEPNSSYVYSPRKVTTTSYKANPDTDFEFSSIQCGQRQRSAYVENLSSDIQDFVDLDPSQPSQHLSQVERAPRINIAGRRLFDNYSDDSPITTKQKLKEPMSPGVQFLWEKHNTSKIESPEVQCLGERFCNTNPESPGCVILGERVPKDSNHSTSSATDSLYNARLTLGNSSGSGGKENIAPKRLVRRSHWLRSPYEVNGSNNSSVAITPKERQIYETITTLANDPEYYDRWIINMNNCRVSLFQLGTSTQDKGWVDAYVINANCRILFRDKHPRISNKHFFFHTASEYFLQKWKSDYAKNIMHEKVITNFKKADSARKLHLSERLNFPSLCNEHWFLFAVDIKTRNFLFLDSAFGESSKLHKDVDDMMIANFRQVWQDCNLKEMHFETYGKVYPNLPKQVTGNDCGVYLVKYMQKYCARNPMACSISPNDVPDMRVRLAIDTLFNDHNSEVTEMDFISTFDIQAYKKKQAIRN